MKKQISINGKDYSSFFPPYGYTVSYNKVNGDNAGYMLDGTYTEDVLSVKAVITATAMPLTDEKQAALITDIFSDDYVTLTYFDTKANGYRTISARYNLTASKHRGTGADGKEYWTGMVITFTER